MHRPPRFVLGTLKLSQRSAVVFYKLDGTHMITSHSAIDARSKRRTCGAMRSICVGLRLFMFVYLISTPATIHDITSPRKR